MDEGGEGNGGVVDDKVVWCASNRSPSHTRSHAAFEAIGDERGVKNGGDCDPGFRVGLHRASERPKRVCADGPRMLQVCALRNPKLRQMLEVFESGDPFLLCLRQRNHSVVVGPDGLALVGGWPCA